MPAKNIDHDAVRDALVADGWTITDDPLRLVVGDRDLYVDLAAERVLAAERGTERIAVEIQTFGSPSPTGNRRSVSSRSTARCWIASNPTAKCTWPYRSGCTMGFRWNPSARTSRPTQASPS